MSRVLRAVLVLPVQQTGLSHGGLRRRRLPCFMLQWRQLSTNADTTRGFEEGWTKDTIPNPTDAEEASECGGHVPLNGTSFLCNPDYILSPKAALKVHDMLNAIQKEVKVTCREAPDGEPVQVAVVVINKMKPTMMFYGRVQLDPAQAAQQLAQALHDKWGVGHATTQSGALLLLSASDRHMYLSKGEGLSKRITEPSVRALLHQHMAPALKEGQYDDAVIRGVRQLRLMVAGKATHGEGGNGGSSGGGGGGGGSGSHRQSGNNTFKMLKPLGGFAVLAVLLSMVVTSMEQQEEERKKREWEQCRAKLDRISREREQRLMAVDQGKDDVLPPSDTCPMCLGEFTGNAAAGGVLMGVDGKPAVTLACSHSFCSECLTQTETCPICLSDATTPIEEGDSGTLPPEDQTMEEGREERKEETHRSSRSPGSRWWFPRSTNRPASDRTTVDSRSKKLASVRKETSFRLKRLQEQHPGIISKKQIDEWKNTRDRKGFKMPPPPQPKRPSPEEEKKFRSNESSGSFGGGRTTGGHGGSW